MHPIRKPVAVFPLLVLVLAHRGVSQDQAELIRLSEAYEEARLANDEEAGRALVLEGATCFNENGGPSLLVADEMGPIARRVKESGSPDLETVRVVSRDVALHGDCAVVTELAGATADVPAGSAIKPWRRTIVAARVDESWKIAHVHSSPYAVWETRIASYEQEDAAQPPGQEGIVFVGSSSILFWKTLLQDFPGRHVIGRGFGGSQLIDSVLYAHRIVVPYRPRTVVVYAGDNDIAFGKSAETVARDFQLLVDTIHTPLPEARIAFVAIKPSISRWQLWPEMRRANALIERFAANADRVDYLDVAGPMLGADGTPKPELFMDDGLHLSDQGYALWTTVIAPWLADP